MTQIPEISAVDPDWSRESCRAWWDPGRRLLKAIRDYQHWADAGGMIARAFCAWCVLRHRFWTVATGADVPLNAQIGGGLLITHPNGIVIHPDAVIGPNCLIFQQATIGTVNGGGAPRIGGHVDIGAGAKVLGDIRIGDHARIGANAVVLCDVPDYGVAVGVPARVVRIRAKEEE